MRETLEEVSPMLSSQEVLYRHYKDEAQKLLLEAELVKAHDYLEELFTLAQNRLITLERLKHGSKNDNGKGFSLMFFNRACAAFVSNQNEKSFIKQEKLKLNSLGIDWPLEMIQEFRLFLVNMDIYPFTVRAASTVISSSKKGKKAKSGGVVQYFLNDWRDFEVLSIKYLTDFNNYNLVAHCRTGKDGGIDATLTNPKGKTALIQCKKVKNNVSVKVVQEFYGVCSSKKVKDIYMFAEKGFTQDAITFAHENRINLVTLNEMQAIMNVTIYNRIK